MNSRDELGEHTREVLVEAGCDGAVIDALITGGAVAIVDGAGTAASTGAAAGAGADTGTDKSKGA